MSDHLGGDLRADQVIAKGTLRFGRTHPEGVQQPYWSRRPWSIIRLGRTREGRLMGKVTLHKFVRLGEYRGSALFGVSDKVQGAYEDVVHEHARDGWRLVQIFYDSPRSAPRSTTS